MQTLEMKKARVGETLRCPHCDLALSKWRVPDNPFVEWPSAFQYICFNDECPYFVDGWQTSAAQQFPGSYRFMYDPTLRSCYAIPVLGSWTLRDGIVEDA